MCRRRQSNIMITANGGRAGAGSTRSAIFSAQATGADRRGRPTMDRLLRPARPVRRARHSGLRTAQEPACRRSDRRPGRGRERQARTGLAERQPGQAAHRSLTAASRRNSQDKPGRTSQTPDQERPTAAASRRAAPTDQAEPAAAIRRQRCSRFPRPGPKPDSLRPDGQAGQRRSKPDQAVRTIRAGSLTGRSRQAGQQRHPAPALRQRRKHGPTCRARQSGRSVSMGRQAGMPASATTRRSLQSLSPALRHGLPLLRDGRNCRLRRSSSIQPGSNSRVRPG